MCQPDAETDADEESDIEDPIEGLSDKHSDLVIEVLLRMLDWMGVHKNTWASSEGVWEMLRSQVPDPDDFPVFSAVKAVVRFLALEVDDVEEFFVEITEHKILRWQRTIAIVDLTKRTTTQLTHASHIVALAAYAPYWEPQFVQYKCVTTVADTY